MTGQNGDVYVVCMITYKTNGANHTTKGGEEVDYKRREELLNSLSERERGFYLGLVTAHCYENADRQEREPEGYTRHRVDRYTMELPDLPAFNIAAYLATLEDLDDDGNIMRAGWETVTKHFPPGGSYEQFFLVLHCTENDNQAEWYYAGFEATDDSYLPQVFRQPLSIEEAWKKYEGKED